jgi:hypothetical protein
MLAGFLIIHIVPYLYISVTSPLKTNKVKKNVAIKGGRKKEDTCGRKKVL